MKILARKVTIIGDKGQESVLHLQYIDLTSFHEIPYNSSRNLSSGHMVVEFPESKKKFYVNNLTITDFDKERAGYIYVEKVRIINPHC